MLYEPTTLRCGVTLANRIALAPLTNLQSQPDGLLGDDELRWLARRARGGFSLVETCAAYVRRDGKAWDGELGIDRDECLPGLRTLAERIHAGGAKAVVQLFHGGLRAEQALTGEVPWGPDTASVELIAATRDAFTAAALRAQAAGFDGVEVHGAHGYVLSQFLSRTQNTRDDSYGGSLENRARLLREITREVRARCGPSFLLAVRLSLEDFGNAHGLDLDESLQVSRWLADDGIDILHASLWDVTKMTAKRPDAHALPLLRDVLPRDVAIMTAGKIWTREDAEETLARGADLVALGRSAILNPDWPRTIAAGEAIIRPPMTRADLAARAVSARFAQYLTRWKDFVAD